MFKCRTIGETSYLNSDLYTPCPYVTLNVPSKLRVFASSTPSASPSSSSSSPTASKSPQIAETKLAEGRGNRNAKAYFSCSAKVLQQVSMCDEKEWNDFFDVVDRLRSVNPGVLGKGHGNEEDLCDAVVAVKINIELFTGHETFKTMSREQWRALFLYDWSHKAGLKTASAVLNRHQKRMGWIQCAEEQDLRAWMVSKARQLRTEKRIEEPSLRWDGSSAEEVEALRYMRIMFDHYKVEKWHWFFFGKLFRLIQTSVLVFIPGRLYQQLSWSFAICFSIFMFQQYQHHVLHPAASALLRDGIADDSATELKGKAGNSNRNMFINIGMLIVVLESTGVLQPWIMHGVRKIHKAIYILSRRGLFGRDDEYGLRLRGPILEVLRQRQRLQGNEGGEPPPP
eukprot:CAMPEP_0206269608 /NCGR_PEP_ID=MMETSP0047_2-20121206/32397_1 /ASSEMBLY_ACC=CAM_ASM_000192 /TAXON_ID=195065 /ORGANISM="Chroomonas mesostigmatica_cf, Strain CCMP1168" /LENGTH=396 /DNA_ID=CAMNT_0053698137 /DNA_START=173 /DNA_END=1361 /DNA_ORIENTATION=-